jgi:NCAIR mutase (PurE)-related protein
MTASELHTQLRELQAERALAHDTGVAGITSYMDDLERDIARSHAAFVGAAVTEIATLRGQLSGRLNG